MFLCRIDDIPVGGARALNPRDDLRLFAVRNAAGVVIYRNRCPHAGFELNWLPDRFLDRDGRFIHCQVHGALFDIATGRCVAGPCAGKHLEPAPFRLLDGDLSLDSTD